MNALRTFIGALYCRLGNISPATLRAAPDLYAAAQDAMHHLCGAPDAVGKGEAIGRLHDALRKADGGAA